MNAKGIDLITINAAGQITEIEVLVRPLNAVSLLFKLMSQQIMAKLQTMSPTELKALQWNAKPRRISNL
jgi:hypothetical protein